MKPKTKKSRSLESNYLGCLFIIGVAVIVVYASFVLDVRHSFKMEHTDELKWWQTTIVYQVYPRSFQDSDGDGTGDLKGIISRLSHFTYLGVGALWISPFYKSPMRDFGYDVSNHTEVDFIFGTLDDFKDLVKEAHVIGLKVILDFVPNHTSNDSYWFERSRTARSGDRYSDYYIWNPGRIVKGKRIPPNNWESVFGGPAWEWDSVRREYYYHNYLTSQPDLNYRNMDVLTEMDDVIRFWLDKGVDGFRTDAVKYLFEKEDQTLDEPKKDSKGFKRYLHGYTRNQPEVFGVVRRWKSILDEYEAEDGKSRVLIAETPGIDHELRMQYYNAGSVPFFFNLMKAHERCGATSQCMLDIIKEGMNLSEEQWPNFVIGSHDDARVADKLGSQYVDAMNMLLLTLPGTPTTYYGEELGMRGGDYSGMVSKDPKSITLNKPGKSRDPERNPMQWDTSPNAGFTNETTPWLPITTNTDYMHVNVEVEKSLKTSSLSIYKQLAALRKRKAFQNAKIDLPDVATEAIVFRRGDAHDRYIIAINFSQADCRIDLTDSLYAKGLVEVSTRPRTRRDISLMNINLKKGEGLVIRCGE